MNAWLYDTYSVIEKPWWLEEPLTALFDGMNPLLPAWVAKFDSDTDGYTTFREFLISIGWSQDSNEIEQLLGEHGANSMWWRHFPGYKAYVETYFAGSIYPET